MQRWSLFKSPRCSSESCRDFSNPRLLGVICHTTKYLYDGRRGIYREHCGGGMYTAAFVALLMTLPNWSFSATQFALLSALSAVGCVYTGSVCRLMGGGLRLELVLSVYRACRNPGIVAADVVPQNAAIHSRKMEQFLPRRHFRNGYRTAMSLLGITAVIVPAVSPILLLTGI